MPPRVVKIGGSILQAPEDFQTVYQWLQPFSSPHLLIISALGSTTRNLEQAARLAEQSNLTRALEILDRIFTFHTQLTVKLNLNAHLSSIHPTFDQYYQELQHLLTGVAITQELTSRTLDRILHYGEHLATHVFAAFLKSRGVSPQIVPATTLIATDQQHLAATVDLETTIRNVQQHLIPVLRQSSVVLTQGFIGESSTGEITTLGFEGSNITAAVLATALNAPTLWILTKVAGIRTADPDLVPDTRAVPQLSYQAAFFLATLGLKILHPRMIQLAEAAQTTIEILSPFHPERTRINATADSQFPILLCVPYERWIYEEQRAFRPIRCLLPDESSTIFKPDPQHSLVIVWGQSLPQVLPHLPSFHLSITHLYATTQPPLTAALIQRQSLVDFLIHLHQQLLKETVPLNAG